MLVSLTLTMKMNEVRNGPWLACVSIAVVLFGCQEEPREIGEADVVAAFVDGLCRPMFSCSCDGQTRYASLIECRQRAEMDFGRLRAEAAGLTYDPSCYGAQLDAIETLGCGSVIETDECRHGCSAYHGDQAEGWPCEVVYPGVSNCAQGLSCVSGMCQDRCRKPRLGESCGTQACDAGLWCEAGICRQLPGEGEACSPFGCVEGTFCDTWDPNAEPTCRSLGTRGDPCRGHAQCTSGYCPTGFCAHLPREGESCAGTFVCEEGLSCRDDICVPARPAVCDLSLPWPTAP